ncbi:uncharacterized protein LOC110991676 isoform X2 [Pieris rapae]|uniref:uncharacterized protein LOC110991676 isoform X2 n=1 Tax=Pieris rapae TaxID=64459 RepID=UPI001E27D2DF|nr:uncharacterized protein LOC110991676 isoform X2 [Pieris rapae]
MTPSTLTTLFAIVLAGATFTQAQTKDYKVHGLDLLRLLSEKPWLLHNRWEPGDQDVGYRNQDSNDDSFDDDLRSTSEKRSAVATALNGRRRRQPTPSLGVLNDVGSFFDSLRDNLETLASLSPEQRSTLFQEPPTVVHAPSSGGGGGGTGMRRLHALRPLRPTGNIRSDLEAYGSYPGANHHDPGLLWTGLGR